MRAPEDGSAAAGGAADGNNPAGNPGGPAGGPQSAPIPQGSQPGNEPPAKGQPGGPHQQQQPQPAAGDLYKPDGLPEHLLGKSNNETIDKLLTANKGFREQQSTRGAVPKDANEYTIELSPDLAKKVGDLTKDKAFGGVRAAALEAGMTNKEFSAFMPKVLEQLDKLGFVPDMEPLDPEKAIGALEADHGDIKDPAARRQAAAQRVVNVKAQLDNLKTAGTIDDRAYQLLFGMLPDPADFRSLEKILALGGMKSVNPGGGGGPTGGETQETIAAAKRDPRYNSFSPKHDPKYREEVDNRERAFISRSRAA